MDVPHSPPQPTLPWTMFLRPSPLIAAYTNPSLLLLYYNQLAASTLARMQPVLAEAPSSPTSSQQSSSTEAPQEKTTISEKISIDRNGRKRFECSICSRSYETLYNYREHMAKHAGKRFACPVCFKLLSGQSALSRHAKVHKKPYACLECDKSFSSTYDLNCHHDYYHTNNRRFRCRHCDRSLYNYSGKLRHESLCSKKKKSETSEVVVSSSVPLTPLLPAAVSTTF